MRATSTMRALMLVAACVACAASRGGGVAAETTTEGNAAVSAGDVLSVTSLSAPSSSILVSALADTTVTLKPATATPATATTTTTTTTTAPTTSDATTTGTSTATVDTTSGTATANSTTSSTTSNATASGAAVTCVFRYSMPTSSNVAEELAAAAAAAATTKDSGSTDGSFDGSSDSSVSVGSKDSTPTATTTTGSGAGGAAVDAGSTGDAGTTTTTKTPSPSATTPTATTKTPAVTTKAPTSTPTATSKTPKPTTSGGSSDGSVRRSLAGMETTEEPSPSPSSTSKKTPTPTPTSTKKSSTTTAPTAGSSSSASSSTPTPTSDSNATSSTTTTTTTTTETGTFSCDANFYGAWAKLGLKCGDADLDVASAVASAQCLIYSGLQSSGVISNMKLCMSACRFPKCTADGAWDYAADDGLASAVYANLNFMQLMRYAGASAAVASVTEQSFSNLTMTTDKQCGYSSEKSFSNCQCNNLLTASSSSKSATVAPALTVPVNKGLADADHWADGQAKNAIDKVSGGAVAIGSSAATVAVGMGGIMSIGSTILGSTSAGVASGVSASASVGIVFAAVDICQFSIMINQMNLDARPRFLEDMGRRMAPAGYGFLPFWKTSNSTNSTSTSTSRRLADVDTTGNQTQGMERYAQLIGVQVDKLFYLTAAGVGALIAALFIVYGLVMGICFPFVDDFGAFARKWLDKAVGVLMMILILSEYVIGVTATFQFCWCIDNNRIDASLFLSIFTLLVLAIGTILYGVVVVKNHEDELRDLGTKDHFDKRVHARYGPLYDEYNFEGRFFFAPKLLLALLCGMTTGMVWLQGLWQIVIMIALHIAFLFYLEVKQPYPTQFVQKTSSFVIIIKISALFLSFFLISSATSFNKDLPLDLREGVGFAIVGLQVLVLICLMIRQVYIFYRTWKLKKEGSEDEDKTAPAAVVTTTNNRDGAENFFALGDNSHQHNNMAVLGEDQHHQQHQYAQETPKFQGGYALNGAGASQTPKLRNLQPSRRSHTVVVHDEPQQQYQQQQQRGYRNNEVDL